MLSIFKKTGSYQLSVLLVGLVFTGLIVAGCTQKPAKKQDATIAPSTTSTVSAEKGKKLYDTRCIECHGRNGKGVPGDAPPLQGLVGSHVKLTDGTTITADDAYILQSIKKPDAKVVKGYNVMPQLGVSDADAKVLIEYIKSLK
ncbi:MAG TPA: cytochrome c [Nitrospirae bacterium]|nr:cytochrome c [Nitrospirota bacterium]